ncbi:MAG: hypothetical protein DRJ52_09270, partial [Thermoprotei archaeon]
QTAHLLSNTQEIWIGPDADLQALLKLRFLQPAVERELELCQRIIIGEEGHYEVRDLDIEWVKKKPYKIITKEPEEIDYLEIIFGEEADFVKRKLIYLLDVSPPKKNFLNSLQADFGEKYIEVYLALVRHGFIKEASTQAGEIVVLTNKALRCLK